jgi:signal transduction histidine kinase
VDDLTRHGLAAALRMHANRFSEATGIEVELDAQLDRRLPEELELLFYSLAQEALSNVRKHAQATRALVRIKVDGGDLVMTVRDNGRGFNPADLPTTHPAGEHVGLASMRQRVQAIRGDLQIESSPGNGTTLIFRCPVPADE